ncbi:DUF6266 family protein [Pararcticibacter amylolyticus]|uniref:Uncharacterized protein n=1 Tax=Pararcticibacter amylolyticus TaxID=2173175 RepID=A0A2U2PLC2_9SPHI|nr:DUF6266 family protein [Pararcticibacter amylolyticus]PWG82128.1 hypothetical protein DDR33_03680 [Pararcticibacter amylolyticus]
MGVYKQGIAGPFSGKVGSIIGSRWRKISYMRGIARKNHKPASPAQLLQRKKFQIMSDFLLGISPLFNRSYSQENTSRKSAYHIALSYHLKYAFTMWDGLPEIDFTKVVLSRGNLPKPLDARAECTPDKNIMVIWSPLIRTSFVSPDDKAMIVIYNSQDKIFIVNSKHSRKEGQALVKIIRHWHDHPLHIFIFFSSDEGNNSPSHYLGVRRINPETETENL